MHPNVDNAKVVDLLADTVKELNTPCATAPAADAAADRAQEGLESGMRICAREKRIFSEF